jgi:Ca2+-binding RTX toxin-like protein
LTITALNIEHVNGNGLDNFLSFQNDVSGMSVDLGAGNDTLALANGVNSVSVSGVENISGSDFGGTNPSDDTLTLLNDVNGITVNLGDGNNTLDLAAGNNTLANIFGIQTVNGSATDDTLTFQNNVNGVSIDLGGGNNTLNLANGFNFVTVNNVETVNGGTGNDNITIANTSGSTTVTGGQGVDVITASAASDNFNFVSTADSATGQGDTIINFDAAHDTFSFTGMGGAGGFASAIHFVGTAGFDGGGQSEAHLVVNGPLTTLQIDVNGDGQMTSADVEIQLANLNGTLNDANFLLR